jgi:dTDP-4-dehydrorhamnose reductase
MRILVLGAGGQLGRQLSEMTGHGHDIVPLSRAECDIAVPGAAAAALAEHRPDAVVNCAAWTKVDAAETQVDDAYRANAIGPRLLAVACQGASVRLCHVSTDYVFDGSATQPVDESARTRPLNVYGASKLAGEEEVRAHCDDHLVVRTSWLYGMQGPNFVLTMLRLGAERDELRVVADQHGAPTWTGHLAPALLRLVEGGAPGTYHLSNGGHTTWAAFAEAIMARARLRARIVAITTAEYAAQAPRPAYAVLDNRAWRLRGQSPLPSWEEGLHGYLDEQGIEGG